jgi:hypothetical protein
MPPRSGRGRRLRAVGNRASICAAAIRTVVGLLRMTTGTVVPSRSWPTSAHVTRGWTHVSSQTAWRHCRQRRNAANAAASASRIGTPARLGGEAGGRASGTMGGSVTGTTGKPVRPR